jgi:hypothetical protein
MTLILNYLQIYHIQYLTYLNAKMLFFQAVIS